MTLMPATDPSDKAAPAVSPDALPPGLDLETWRQREGLTFQQLASEIGTPSASQARRYALGERWPDPDVIETIKRVTLGEVTIFAMHRRRTQWFKHHGGIRRLTGSAGA